MDERLAAPAARAAAPPEAALGEVMRWASLAAAALGIAGAFAFLLAFSRVPGSERLFAWPQDFFQKGLVIHVVFSFVIWFLAMLGALTALVCAGRPDGGSAVGTSRVARLGFLLAMLLLLVPAFLDRGEPNLNNYIPVIIDPLYYGGLVVLAGSVALISLRMLLNSGPAALTGRPLAACVACAAAAAIVALVCFALAWSGSVGTTPGYWFNENLAWGGGHAAQFVNTILVVTAWAALARVAAGPGFRIPVAVPIVCLALLAVSLASPLFYVAFPLFSGEQAQAFTWLQYALGPLAAVAALSIARALPRRLDRDAPASLFLVLSWALFAVGGAFGFFVDGADTRTPAHYHGVIAAVTLAFMGLFYVVLLPTLGRAEPTRRRAAWTAHLFAWGQLAACVGLFLAGGHGAPRKVAGEAQGLDGVVAYFGMGLNGLGGLIAVIGGVVFVVTVLLSLARPSADDVQRRESPI